MKRIIAGIIALSISAVMFCGCSSGENSSIPDSTDPNSSQSDSDNSDSKQDATDEGDNKKDVAAQDEYETGGIMINGSGENVRAIELYGGNFEWGSKYAEYINAYKEKLGDMVNVYNMCIPTAFAYYLPSKYEDEYGSEYDNIRNIQSQLKNVIDVDIYNTLADHADEYIYFRTDHHWQPLGAYYAAQVFAERSAVSQFPDLSTYEKVVYNGFCGSLEGYAQSSELSNNPDTFTYYKPANLNSLTTTYYDTDFTNGTESMLFFEDFDMKNAYSTFLGDDREIAQIDTNVANGRTLVIFKDSFGNALVPFLTQSFEHIYVCDIRYFDINAIDFCQSVGATDVLFATCMFTNTADKAEQIKTIMNQ